MKKKTVILFTALMLSVPAVGSVSAASSYETEVEYGVNFRTGPGTGYKVIRMLPRGEDVHVIEKVNSNWLKIETKDGTIGYISADPKYTDYTGNYETVVEYGVNFRTGPGTGYKVIKMLSKGTKIHVIEKVNNNWLKIQTQDGTTGYISADPKYTNYAGGNSSPSNPSVPVIETPSSSNADAIIATAKSLIGKAEYDFGTRDPKRLIFDCSSFTQYVFGKHGIELKWGTRYQKDAGTYVSKSNLQKGDLVFFSVGSSSSIGHVGIYISNGDFIHILDKSVSDVHISNLNSGYWKDHYITARRVL